MLFHHISDGFGERFHPAAILIRRLYRSRILYEVSRPNSSHICRRDYLTAAGGSSN